VNVQKHKKIEKSDDDMTEDYNEADESGEKEQSEDEEDEDNDYGDEQ